jgi:hypothetical protein
MSAPTACKHTVSGSISLPCSGFFSPFPHGTGSLSVSQEYLALPDGAGNFPQGVSNPAVLRIPLCLYCFPVRSSHALWRAFPCPSGSLYGTMTWSYNPQPAVTGWVWASSLSLATTQEITIVFFSSAYLDVSVQQVRA